MKRIASLVAGLAFGVGLSATGLAGGINLSGPHYNLNIIGVENPKSSPMTGSDRHTIFVGLSKNDTVTTRIYLTPGPFQVCDGNGFDPAYACDGTIVGRSDGAVFQLPCNTAVPTDTGCADGTVSASYQIWARALGTPGGSVTMTTCAFDDTGAKICSSEFAVLARNKGKSTFSNVTNELSSIDACFDVGGNVVCEVVSLFDPQLEDYFWQYANTGVRLVQLRFYPE
jgi:hypothetical protein